MNVKVVYEETGEERQLAPVWMIIDSPYFEWEKTLFIDIQIPFERLTFDDIESDLAAVSVPEAAYTRHIESDHLFGINLPIVWQSAFDALERKPKVFDLRDIRRIVLRICDIEDTMRYDISKQLVY